MNIQGILSIADSLKSNQINEELKIHWLNDVEGRVQCEILKSYPKSFSGFTTMKQELSVPAPYTRMYISYLLAMIAFAEKEYDLYTDLMMRYENEFSEYAKFCLRTR